MVRLENGNRYIMLNNVNGSNQYCFDDRVSFVYWNKNEFKLSIIDY